VAFTYIAPGFESYMKGLIPWTEESIMQCAGADCIKKTHNRFVVRLQLDGEQGTQVFYCKRYSSKRLRRLLPQFNKARREFKVTDTAHKAGLPVAQAAAYAHTSNGDSFLALTEVGKESDMRETMRRQYSRYAPSEKREMLQRLAQFLASIHAKGLMHDDLEAEHIRLDDDGFYIIDLDNAKMLPRVPDWRRLHNLVQLYRSLRSLPPRTVDAYRLFRYYADCVPGWPEREKEYWRRMQRAMVHRLNAKRGLLFRTRYRMLILGWNK
jgi:tRNA A-37 threonylcarbamoyl transferase component Bud32